MITRNRIKFSEKQAALIWQQMVGKELPSLEDELVSVIYPGRTNGDNGPDFRDAVIVNKSHLTKGDVEVHVKSSDWYSHKHHADAEYNNVILHVETKHQKPLRRYNHLFKHYQKPLTLSHNNTKLSPKLIG